MSGTLYLVATPIGNLKDITARAVDVLAASPVIAAEDTRRTRALLAHLGIGGKRLESLHAHSSDGDVQRVARHLTDGVDVAYATDAGTPLVSDPGSALVAAALSIGATVVPVPGPSAVLAALVGSGLAGDAGFRFMAFLPREGARRRDAIARVAGTPEAVVLLEAANRLTDTLRDLAAVMPARPACVARELTKVHEELVRGPLATLAEDTREWRGEIALVLGAWTPEEGGAVGDEDIERRITEELDRGLHARAVADRVAAWSGRPRREVYARVVARKGER